MASTRYLVLRYGQLRAKMCRAAGVASNGPALTRSEELELTRVYSELYSRHVATWKIVEGSGAFTTVEIAEVG